MPQDTTAEALQLLLPPALSFRHLQRAVFTSLATVTAVASNIGSLAGALPLNISVGGAGAVVGEDRFTRNQVTVGGMPCPILSVPNPSTIICQAPAMYGYVQADFWNFQPPQSSLPDLQTWTDPGGCMLHAQTPARQV